MEFAFSGIVVRYCAKESSDSLSREAKLEGEEKTSPEGERTLSPSVDLSTAPVPAESQSGLTSDVPEDQLHVNLWEVGGAPVLDLGIMIHNWRDISAIQVDLPWAVGPHDINDLGARLSSEKKVAAVFNEVVHYDGCADLSYAKISFRPSDYVGRNPNNEKNKGHFALLRLNSKSYETSTLHSADGTLSTQLRVNIPANIVDTAIPRIYIRFRIKNVPSDMYSSVFRQKDRNLLSSSTETRIIDFRINVRRGVPDEILSSDDKVWFPHFKKIHFFLTIDRAQICEFESQNFVGCRSLLDEDVWNDYIKSNPSDGIQKSNSVRHYLGYQWTASADTSKIGDKGTSKAVKDLVVLGRFSHVKSNKLYVVRFVVLALIFGMSGSALWDVFKPIQIYAGGVASYFSAYWHNILSNWKSLLTILIVLSIAWLLTRIPLDKMR